MQKDIPGSQENRSRSDRLREASTRLQVLPLERVPTDAEWDAATGDLTSTDLEHLKRLAVSYRERAVEGGQTPEERREEAESAVLLWPRDSGWARECLKLYREGGWADASLLNLLARRTKAKGARPRWLVPFFVALVAVPAGLGLAVVVWNALNRNAAVSPIQGPRDLEAVFDTQGVKANIQVAQSRLLIFPESTVAEVSAWVTFPDHRVDLWEGTVSVLDAQGQPLTTRDVVFHADTEGPLTPGQGVDIFEQFDAWPFYDKVSSFQIATKRILAQESKPSNRAAMDVGGLDSLTQGYGLKVWIQDSRWQDRFASKVQTLVLEVENTGLKPFAELQFALVWRDPAGKALKTLTFRPVSPFRNALPSGGRLPWTQETVFDTEVFSWPAGEEPHPVLELRQWQ